MPNLLTSSSPLSTTVIPPLISTTASLAYAIFEILVFRGLVSASEIDHAAAARTISAWWKATYFQGLGLIVTAGLCSLSSGILAIRSYESRSAEWWLAVSGTAFAVGHFAFAPTVVPVIDAMVGCYDTPVSESKEGTMKKRNEKERDIRSIELQRWWNRVHLVRTVSVDLPAVLCFVALALWRS